MQQVRPLMSPKRTSIENWPFPAPVFTWPRTFSSFVTVRGALTQKCGLSRRVWAFMIPEWLRPKAPAVKLGVSGYLSRMRIVIDSLVDIDRFWPLRPTMRLKSIPKSGSRLLNTNLDRRNHAEVAEFAVSGPGSQRHSYDVIPQSFCERSL